MLEDGHVSALFSSSLLAGGGVGGKRSDVLEGGIVKEGMC